MKSKTDKDKQEVYLASNHQFQSEVDSEIQVLGYIFQHHINLIDIILAAVTPLWTSSTLLFSISEHTWNRPNTENLASSMTYAIANKTRGLQRKLN